MGSECEASDHTGGLAVDGDPTERRRAEPTRDDGGTGRQRVTRQRGVRTRGAGRGAPHDKVRNNAAETPATPGGEERAVVGTSSVGTYGPYHSTRRGWKQQEPPGGGPVSEPEWTRSEAGPAEAHGWRHQQTGWYFIEMQPAHQAQFNRAIRTNCQPDSQPTLKPEGCPDEEVT